VTLAQVAVTGATRVAFFTSAAFVFLVLVFVQFARAQEQDCPNATSTMDFISCYHNVVNRTEAEVQGKYQQILNLAAMRENPKLRESFQHSQQTWIACRKETCDGVWEFWNPGTAKNTEALRCEILLDRERTRVLDSLYNVPLHH
jgi:uncharacterized protein YecT (DUF1311 family)